MEIYSPGSPLRKHDIKKLRQAKRPWAPKKVPHEDCQRPSSPLYASATSGSAPSGPDLPQIFLRLRRAKRGFALGNVPHTPESATLTVTIIPVALHEYDIKKRVFMFRGQFDHVHTRGGRKRRSKAVNSVTTVLWLC